MSSNILVGWKRVARHFGVSKCTVKRWADALKMPVHRLHKKGSPIFALKNELNAWVHKGETRIQRSIILKHALDTAPP